MRDVIKWLNTHNLFWINIKTTGTYDARIGGYRKSPYTLKGTSDLLVIHQTQPIFIELKRPKGGRISPDQILFKKLVEDEGVEYYIVRGIKDLEGIFGKNL